MLEGFELNEDFFLSDLIHPNESAQPIILETIWKKLKMMVDFLILQNASY